MLHAKVRFITDLGTEVHIPVELTDTNPYKIEEAILNCQRTYGSRGWRPGDIPPGGYYFPLANEEDFDWNLIGGFRTTRERNGEVEEGVYHGGHFYVRRTLEAVESRKMNLPAAVKYSRGARPTDPPEIREKADGDIEYVTLAIFRGAGKKREKFVRPDGPHQPAQTPTPAPANEAIQQAAPAGNTQDHEQLANIPKIREAMQTFIREAGQEIDETKATITIGGRKHNLVGYVRNHWSKIKDDAPLLATVVKAVEINSGRNFQAPAGV